MDNRQGGESKKAPLPVVEVTPEMVEAGVKVLRGYFTEDEMHYRLCDIIVEVYAAMATARRTSIY